MLSSAQPLGLAAMAGVGCQSHDWLTRCLLAAHTPFARAGRALTWCLSLQVVLARLVRLHRWDEPGSYGLVG